MCRRFVTLAFPFHNGVKTLHPLDNTQHHKSTERHGVVTHVTAGT